MNVSKICWMSANSVDPDQTPRSAASDLGLHCFSEFRLFRTDMVVLKLLLLLLNFLL